MQRVWQQWKSDIYFKVLLISAPYFLELTDLVLSQQQMREAHL